MLALALALGAVVALGLTLVASVHRRRRDLALLRTLGFTSRQLLSTVAWRASVGGEVGAIFGIPFGIVIGRWLWTLFADNIYAVPRPTVPTVSLIVVAITAMVLERGRRIAGTQRRRRQRHRYCAANSQAFAAVAKDSPPRVQRTLTRVSRAAP